MAVFVSYAREDRDQVESLVQSLEELGYEIWWDDHLKSGEGYVDEIRRRLNAAKAVIVIWSAASVAKSYVLYEASIADGRNVLLSFHFRNFNPGGIPSPLVWRNSRPWDDLNTVTHALDEKGVTPSSGPRITIPKELRADLSAANPLLPQKLLVFLRKASAAGFAVDIQNSIILKSHVPGKGIINFGGITRHGKLETTRIGERAETEDDQTIALEHLNAVARLIPNASVNREKNPWTWRVEVNRHAPDALARLSHPVCRGLGF